MAISHEPCSTTWHASSVNRSEFSPKLHIYQPIDIITLKKVFDRHIIVELTVDGVAFGSKQVEVLLYKQGVRESTPR